MHGFAKQIPDYRQIAGLYTNNQNNYSFYYQRLTVYRKHGNYASQHKQGQYGEKDAKKKGFENVLQNPTNNAAWISRQSSNYGNKYMKKNYKLDTVKRFSEKNLSSLQGWRCCCKDLSQ